MFIVRVSVNSYQVYLVVFWLFEEWPRFGGSVHTAEMTPGDKHGVRDPENQRLWEVCQRFSSNQSFKLDLQMLLLLSGESGE